MRTAKITIIGALALATACGQDPAGDPPRPPGDYRGEHAHTLLLGRSDNAEIVKIVAGTRLALLVSSKARKITLLRMAGAGLEQVRSRALFAEDPGESELTHIDVHPGGAWAAVTRTLVDQDGSGKTTACRGELVLVDVADSEAFGAVLARIAVGPMPDAVDISDDGRYAAVANERDKIWGKCEGVDGLEPPSVSIVDVRQGPAAAAEIKRVVLTGKDAREPEHVAFSADGDLIAVTLQDSHEIALVRISALDGVANPADEDVTIFALPKNALGQDPWPDGVARFHDGEGRELFAAAGEANDTFCVFDGQGTIVANVEFSAGDIPAGFPRDGSWGPLFRPDSVDAFVWQQKPYLAFTLKASGAVGIWQVADTARPRFVSAIKIGKNETASAEEESSIGPEGISASGQLGFIITANEGESSASLITPR